MHQLYFVLVKDESEHQTMTPQQAIDEAVSVLDSNNFCGGEGYFSGSKGDWYQVGGRWANFFTNAQPWAKQAVEEINQMIDDYCKRNNLEERIELAGTFYGNDEKRKHQTILGEKAEMIWARNRPTGYPLVLFNRWGDSPVGQPQIDDCAVRFTPELAEYLEKHNYAKGVEVFDPIEYHEVTIDYILHNSDIYPPEMLKECYLVAIDYHT
jgi:hypothetical protein